MATTAQLKTRLIIGTALVLTSIACGGASSVTGPTGSSTARITGRVNGTSAASAASTSSSTLAEAATTSLRVSIIGTNITTNVDGSGQFTLTGVPPGDVTLEFTGAGVSARLTLAGVAANQEVQIEVRLNGNSARIESDRRGRNDDDDEDEDDEDEDDDDEVEGTVSGRTGTCPSLTFTVAGRTVRTSSTTVFDDPCPLIQDNVRVEVKGTRAANGTFTALRVEIEEEEIEGRVSGLTGTCPALTFTLAGRTVTTNSATQFRDIACAGLANTQRVEVRGVTVGGTLTATRVKRDN